MLIRNRDGLPLKLGGTKNNHPHSTEMKPFSDIAITNTETTIATTIAEVRVRVGIQIIRRDYKKE